MVEGGSYLRKKFSSILGLTGKSYTPLLTKLTVVSDERTMTYDGGSLKPEARLAVDKFVVSLIAAMAYTLDSAVRYVLYS